MTTEQPGTRDPEVARGVLRVRLPHPVPEIRSVNVFLVEGGDGWSLVDGGEETPDAERVLGETMKGAGLAPSDIKRVFLTHRHGDHLGFAAKLEAAGAELIMHGPERQAMLADAANGAWAPRQVVWLARHGVPRDDLGQNGMGFTPREPYRFDHVTEVADGALLDLGGRPMRVMRTPGHTENHAVLIDEREGLLFSGDHLLPLTSVVWFNSSFTADNPLGDYLDSMRRLAELRPPMVMPGHGQVIADPSARLKAIFALHEELFEKVYDSLGDEPLTAYDVARLVFPQRSTAFAARTATLEMLSHLRHLARQGRVQELAGEPVRWRRS